MSDDRNASSSSSLIETGISHSRKTVKSYGISIDSSKIHEVAVEEQPDSLRELGVNVFDQDVFEEGVLQQVDEAIAAQEEALEKERLEKDLKTVGEQLRITEHQLSKTKKDQQATKLLALDHENLIRKKEHLLQRLGIAKDIQETGIVINNKETGAHIERKESEISDEDSAERLLQIRDHQETEIERLIRLGEMTPFGSRVDNGAQMDAKAARSGEKSNKVDDETFEKSISALSSEFEGEASTSKARTESHPVIESGDGIDDDYDEVDNDDYNFLGCFDNEEKDDNVPQMDSDDDYVPDDEELKLSWKEELIMSDCETTQPDENVKLSVKAKKKKKHKSKPVKKTGKLYRTTRDDGDDRLFQKRIREAKLKKILREKGIDYSGKSDEEEESWDEDFADEEFDGGLKIPGAVWNKLFRYQKTGVKWLWELHCQQAGGIVGDEMGLGKTIQLIAFLAGLKYSKIGRRSSKQTGLGPVLIVCPATVMYQWVAEFHKWWPEFRVAVLHDTASYQGPKDTLINKIRNFPGVLITTYSGVRLNQEHLLPSRWDYVILDEGHTIRNPNAETTLACKQFRTPHRLVLSGSPMQNNLRELWSLFDFVFPGKLGTLPVFMQEFSVPITMGGYANATQVQVQTAYKCACVLRDTINPYLLRRLKKDVKMTLGLPNKNEQVLFCRLTEEQTEIYKEYLASREVGSILSGSMKVFPGLIMLRKICNHPDLTSEAGSLWKLRKDLEMAETGRAVVEEKSDSEYGQWRRSGKLVVVHSLLKLWKRQKHKVLLFTQTRQMLKILEMFVKSQGYEYSRMDGSTAISSRQPLVERFNKEKSIFVFLLTTRVGGLGVNLVGANRVIIYDPDWNPGTDMQAKERAWRVGQKKDVTIYRLLTTGTIEEKIYHRQIFKQFLTNRVLKDPKQRRFFKSNDLFELFTLDTSDNTKTGTETGAIFAGLGCEVKVPSPPQRKGTKRRNTELPDSASALKMMKEKTKEILKSQFSRSKETVAVSNDDPHRSGIDKDNNVSSGDNCVDISGPSGIAPDASGDARKVSIRTPGCTYDSDNMTKCNESTIHEYSVKRNTNGSVCLEQFSAGCGSSDIRKTGTNSDVCDVARAQASSKDLLESEERDLDVVSEQTSSAAIDDATKMKAHDGSSSVPRKEDKGKMKKKSKKKKRNKIEGIRIGQLSHSEPYLSKKDSEDGENQHDDDHYILRKLFKKSGVHSALQHDTIVNSGNSDHILVENEAQRVAAQAAEALKRSRERCMLDRSSGLPTWTGRSGVVGSPYGVQKKNIFGPKAKAKSKTQCKEDASEHFSGKSLLGKADDATKATAADPMSSTQLLARMRARNFIGGNNAGSEVPSGEQKYEQTMSEVRTFIETGCSRPGMATTREILARFSARLPVSDSAIFRAMLRTICDFERGVSGEGYWVLKTEY